MPCSVRLASLAVPLLAFASTTHGAEQPFSAITGPLAVQPVANRPVVNVPYITWGGDAATFFANGGLETTPDSLYGKQGLKLRLTAGDDFVQQVRDYMGGKSPFLRGTYRMLGQASEVIGKDPRTKPVVILQLSWSAGDHVVVREGFRTLNDLKPNPQRNGGKKVRIACQQGGPHVGLLYDALDAAQLTKDDVEVVFVKDLTGPGGAAEKFRGDPTIDACCVITPDMIGLTGGLDSAGTGAEGTVTGARVLVSTQNMSRSIADVYAVRADWYRANRPAVEKFVAAYLAGAEKVKAMRDDYERTQRMTADYRRVLELCQSTFGEAVLPTLEVDAHGLLLDCRFVNLPGQIAFFEQSGNLNGFAAKLKSALDMATAWGYATGRYGFDPSGLDYRRVASLAGLAYSRPQTVVEGESIGEFLDDDLEEGTIVSFTISFEPNQTEFSVDQYGAEFDRALKSASTFGGAAVVIRGHSDPTKTLVQLVKAGLQKGVLRRTGTQGAYRYFLNAGGQSRELDLGRMDELVRLIESGAFEGTADGPAPTMQAALNLSLARAEAVRKAIADYARQRDVTVNLSQLQAVGAGISEPVVAKPTSMAEAKQNMRVEFRIVKVDPETLKESDFDF